MEPPDSQYTKKPNENHKEHQNSIGNNSVLSFLTYNLFIAAPENCLYDVANKNPEIMLSNGTEVINVICRNEFIAEGKRDVYSAIPLRGKLMSPGKEKMW